MHKFLSMLYSDVMFMSPGMLCSVLIQLVGRGVSIKMVYFEFQLGCTVLFSLNLC